jgi:cell division protein FtsW
MTKGSSVGARAHRADYVLALSIFTLLSIGLVIIYSISPILSQKLTGNADRNYYFLNQIKYIGIGLGVWIVTSGIRYDFWKKYASLLLGISILGLFALLIPGISRASHGATRWIDIGPFSIQPAEVMKVALILYLAAWFEKRSDDIRSFWDGLVPFIIMVGLASFVIVVFQRDMGTMLVLAGAAVAMFFTAGIRWTHLGVLFGAGLAAGLAAIVAFPHRISRVLTFLDPTKDSSGSGYHINQALIAIGSGGILGVGLGHSIQVYGYLPEAANDSIFAIIAEEFGLIGSLIIVGLFGFVVYRGFVIAKAAPDTFSRLTATGISAWFGLQAAINIGAMLSIVPLTGIPLPWISYGGTSLIISMFGAGILLNISKFTQREESYANRSERRGDSRAYNANSSYQRRVKIAR